MTAKDAAETFRIWAADSGLINKNKLTPEQLEVPETVLLQAISPLSESSVAVLRHRGINFVGFDDHADRILVFTSRKVTKKEQAQLPNSVDGIPVVYRVGATATIGAPPPFLGNVPYTIRNNFYTCGSSVYVANRVDAGTMGCLVQDGAGDLYGLTNNHISGGCNFSDPGLPILAPGPLDVGANGAIDPFTIGHHHKLLPMMDGTPDNISVTQNTDAAIFKIKNPGLISSMQRDFFDTPTQSGTFSSGMAVEKVGRSTGLTNGTVLATIVGPECVSYNIPALGISKVVYYDPIYVIEGIAGQPFARPGDSGSLISTVDGNGNRIAIGIVVGGDAQNCYALPIDRILADLGVHLVSGHNI